MIHRYAFTLRTILRYIPYLTMSSSHVFHNIDVLGIHPEDMQWILSLLTLWLGRRFSIVCRPTYFRTRHRFYEPVSGSNVLYVLQTILTRKNSITGIQYRDDPTIFGWELMNEPRCMTDASGDTLQVSCKVLILTDFWMLNQMRFVSCKMVFNRN